MFWKAKKKSGLETLRDAAAEHAHSALESAQEFLHQASDIAGKSSRQARKTVEETRKTVGEKSSDARQLLENKRRQLEKKIDREPASDFRRELPTVVIHQDTQNWLWLTSGLLIGTVLGALIGVLLAPSRGSRSRALVRDKLSKGAHKIEGLGAEVVRKTHDLSNRAEGVMHAVSEKLHPTPDDADDVTIADRVRTALGRLESLTGAERINIDVYEGLVTLRGPVSDTATLDAVLGTAQKVEGVREIKSDLIIE